MASRKDECLSTKWFFLSDQNKIKIFFLRQECPRSYRFRLCKRAIKDTFQIWQRRRFDIASTGGCYSIYIITNLSERKVKRIGKCQAVNRTCHVQNTSIVVLKLIGKVRYLLRPVIKRTTNCADRPFGLFQTSISKALRVISL